MQEWSIGGCAINGAYSFQVHQEQCRRVQITISKEEEEQDDKEVENKLEEVVLEQPREAFVTAPAIAEQQCLKVTMETWLILILVVGQFCYCLICSTYVQLLSHYINW